MYLARQLLQVGRADDSHLKSSQCVAVSSPLGRHCVARVKSVEASVVGFADSHGTGTRRGVPSVVATGVAEPFGNRSWGKPPRPRCRRSYVANAALTPRCCLPNALPRPLRFVIMIFVHDLYGMAVLSDYV